MNCPVCYSTISTKRKKQIKHLYTHSVAELALTVLHLDRQIAIYTSADAFRQEQPATLALDDPGGLWPVPGDPDTVFSLVEEDSEEDSDEAMATAGMQQCAHCGLWVWPGDMPYHLTVACGEIGEQPGADDGVHDPGDYQTAAPVEERGDYATVEYIRIPVDGAEYMLLNALALYIHRTNGNG